MKVWSIFHLVSFLFTTVLPAHSTMDQQAVKLPTYTGKSQEIAIWGTRFLVIMKRKGLYMALLWTEEKPNVPASRAMGQATMTRRIRRCWEMHLRKKLLTSRISETTIWLIPPRTDSRINDTHADERWVFGRWRHQRWSNGLEGFSGKLSWFGDAESGDFSDAVGSIATQWFYRFGQLLHQRTVLAHKAKKPGDAVREPFSTPWPSMVCQGGMKLLLCRRASAW